MQAIRNKKRAISIEEAEVILESAEYGVLSLVCKNNQAYGIPLSFCIMNNFIYFHCALDGFKINCIKNNNQVSFCVVGKTQILPDKFGTKYESVIIFGKASEVFDDEKQQSLEGLLVKYSKNYINKGLKYIQSLTDVTRVFKISMDNISAKARYK